MTDEFEKQIEPFTVRDALIQHDKRINQLTDLSHDTQSIVKNFEAQFSTLIERINKGVSPTMQQIKDQNSELKNQIVEFKGDVKNRFTEMNGRIDLVEQGLSDRVGDLNEFISNFRRTAWQTIGALILAAITGLFAMAVWVKSQQSKVVDELIPTLNSMKAMISKPSK